MNVNNVPTKPERIRPSHERTMRMEAINIISNIEDLIIEARRRNETIPQTRLYHLKIIAGYNPETPPAAYKEAKYGDEIPSWMTARPDPRAHPRLVARLKREANEREKREREAEMEEDNSNEEREQQQQQQPYVDAGDNVNSSVEVKVEVQGVEGTRRMNKEEQGQVGEGEDLEMGTDTEVDDDGGVRVDVAAFQAESSVGPSQRSTASGRSGIREKRKRR